jgi:phage terminase Nu1 subunit (DNA packaging protein)
MAQYVNRQQISKLLMLSPRRINQLAKQGVIPKEEEGKYELIGAVQGYISYLKEKASDQVEGVISIGEAKQRKLAAEARRAELLYDLESSQVARLNEIKLMWDHLAVAMKTKLLAIPNKVTPLIISQDNFNYVKTMIHDSIAEALNELAKGDEARSVRFDQDGGEDSSQPDSTTDS